MIENFGSYLKHERELRGVSLEEISGTTKIHIRFLQALEKNNFDELPGEVFIKGYIRSYANIIGSDVEEILNIYEESVLDKSTRSISESKAKPNISATKFLGFGLIGLFLVILIFLVKFQLLDGNISTPKKMIPSTAIPSLIPKKETTAKIEKESLEGELAENSLSEISVAEETQQLKREKDNLIPKLEIQKQGNGSDIKEEMGSKNFEKSLKLTI